MKTKNWLSAAALGLMMLPGYSAFAQGNGKGHGNGNGNGKGNANGHYKNDKNDNRDDDDDRRGYGFAQHDRDEIRGWYGENSRHLPPALAKKDQLPPGLERQLVVRGRLPPGLEKRTYAVPVELERRLPPPPPDAERVVVGGHIVLMNRNTKVVLDIFHFD